jgi:hypothetical protein
MSISRSGRRKHVLPYLRDNQMRKGSQRVSQGILSEHIEFVAPAAVKMYPDIITMLLFGVR